MTFWMVFISNRPDRFVKSVRLFHCGHSDDRVIVFVHASQKDEFLAAIEASEIPFKIEVWTHNVAARPDRKPPLGAIRYHAFNRIQQAMDLRDTAWMADDDAKNIRWAQPGGPTQAGRGKHPSYRVVSPTKFRAEIIKVATVAREYGFWYFTHIMNMMPHNGYRSDRVFRACASWNAFFGFFKTSPNTFDTTMGDGEDYDAAYQAVTRARSLPILRHYGLGIDFEFVRNKYVDSGRIQELKNRYPDLDIIADTNGRKKGMPFPHFSRKKLNELKATVLSEFQ